MSHLQFSPGGHSASFTVESHSTNCPIYCPIPQNQLCGLVSSIPQQLLPYLQYSPTGPTASFSVLPRSAFCSCIFIASYPGISITLSHLLSRRTNFHNCHALQDKILSRLVSCRGYGAKNAQNTPDIVL